MATADSVKTKMQGLIDSANAKTGASDATLTAAVNTLIAGFGSGGGGGGTSGDSVLKEVIEGTIIELVDENITIIYDHALRWREQLTKVSLPNCTSVKSYAFAQCSALTDIYLPKCEIVGGYAFQQIGAEHVVLPSVTSSLNTTFLNAKQLKIVDLNAPSGLSTNAFKGCAVLDTLILRKTGAIVTLHTVAAFADSPFASGGTGGTVYVPSDLIESYKTATNWVTLYEAGTCNFVALEGSEYE